MKKAGGRKLFATLFFVAALFAVFLLFHGERREDVKKTADPKPAAAASAYTVTVSREAQETDGITTEVLKPLRHRMKVAAYGRVLDPEGINASRRTYVAATADVEKAEAALNASEKEYERMKTLNEKAKNVSDRALQAAAARLASDRADAASARGKLQSAKDAISLKWGATLSGWIFDYSPPLRSVLEARDVLVQITVPPALAIQEIPKNVMIEPPTGGEVSATFVSRATTTDPKIQGISFIYIAPSRFGSLLPGMDVAVQMSLGKVQTGFFVPLRAVVWLRGKAWVYIKKSETGFSRVEVPTHTSLSGGYFVSGVFSSGDELVIKGAQALLSEETKPKAGGGGEEEDED